MIEQVFQLAQGDTSVIEKVIANENVHYNHMILGKGEGLPQHFSNSNVYMTVVRGLLSIGLGEQEVCEYPAGTILKIPQGIHMNAKNLHDEILEFTVIKVPAPGR